MHHNYAQFISNKSIVITNTLISAFNLVVGI